MEAWVELAEAAGKQGAKPGAPVIVIITVIVIIILSTSTTFGTTTTPINNISTAPSHSLIFKVRDFVVIVIFFVHLPLVLSLTSSVCFFGRSRL